MLRPLVPVLLFSLASMASGCGSGECEEPPTVAETPEPDGIHGFSSESSLRSYVAPYAAQNTSSGCADSKSSMAEAAAAPSTPSMGATTANEAITNNQEAGVDEGGIVKNVGDALVVLRQGRLYAVDVADGKAPTLLDSMAVARTGALNGQVWYDEMIVKGDLVYVIGYRYGVAAPGESVRGATEVDSFRLTNGKLARLRSMFLESNDYYSSRDYASRLVDGKLVFYMPHVIRGGKSALAYPRVLEVDDGGRFSVVGPIFGALDVFTSLTRPSYATFHTVIKCELPDTGALDCHGRSVIGSYWNQRYVSADAVYLWASSHVYRFDFATLAITAHKVAGAPIDQFSFRQSETELLVATNNVTSVSNGAGTATPTLLRMPLAAFDRRGQQAVSATPLGPAGSIARNRFVGDSLVASVMSSYAAREVTLVSMDTKTGATSTTPSDPIVRIEPLGTARALVVAERRTTTPTTNGSTGTLSTPGALELRAVSPTDVASELGTITLDGVREGEGRSHGFFYKPGDAGAGTFGYAVVNPPEYGARPGFGNGISNLGFFDVTETGNLASLGIVSSGDVAGRCETSCIDWYGNTRPIFLGGRVFALMGSELAEVSLQPAATKGAAVELR